MGLLLFFTGIRRTNKQLRKTRIMNVTLIKGQVDSITGLQKLANGAKLCKLKIRIEGTHSKVEIQVWNDIAKQVRKNIKVGDNVIAVGKVRLSEWEGKAGGLCGVTAINADHVVPESLLPTDARNAMPGGSNSKPLPF